MTAPKFRPAMIEDYVGFLRMFVDKHGQDRLEYGQDWLEQMLVAVEDFRLHNDCGVGARIIIVPVNEFFRGGDLGHCQLLFADGNERSDDNRHLPIWDHPVFRDIGLGMLIDVERQKARDLEAKMDARRRMKSAEQLNQSDLAQYLAAEVLF